MSALDHVIAPARRTRAELRPPLDVLAPIVLVGCLLALAVGIQLALDHGNLTGLIQLGSHYTAFTRPPAGALVSSPDGYDGQFFYLQATDPLLLHDATVHLMSRAGAGFRMQRLAYPALAALLAAGHRGALPATLLAANVMILLALTATLAVYARRRGWPTLWVLAASLTPGLVLATLRDLGDPLATSAAVVGLLAWGSRRRWAAAGLLTVAVLAREAMMLAVLAVVIDAGLQAWRARGQERGARGVLARVWPVIAVPTAAFIVWQSYVAARYGGSVGNPDFSVPAYNLIQEARWSIAREPTSIALLDCLYLTLIVAATLQSVQLLRRRATLLAIGAVTLALSVLVPLLGDIWSDTRLSSPLFVLLALAGLERRDRPALLIAGTAAALTLPLVALGSF